MNILIADSGSTKTEWMLLNANGEKQHFLTDGLNPYFLSEEQLITAIKDGITNKISGINIHAVYFYGSGCGRASTRKLMHKVISTCFGNAEIFVESDLLAAARACLGETPGIACILGTGSNSCLYDGEKITDNIPSLGFVLGDEGSGGYFGKRILQSYFYNIMPEDLRRELDNRHNMQLEHILNQVYKESQGNRFVASFAHLLGDNSGHPFIKELVREGFEEFADKQLSYFDNTEGQTVGFAGSIAAFHSETLKEVLAERGLKLGSIVRKPIEALADYHIKAQASGN